MSLFQLLALLFLDLPTHGGPTPTGGGTIRNKGTT